MITQSLVKYEEPKPVVTVTTTQPQTNTQNTWGKRTFFTQKEINDEWNRAKKEGINLNNIYQYPNSNVRIKILGYNFDPATMEAENFKPCVLKGLRMLPFSPDLPFNYSVSEILEMAKVYE